MRTHRARFALAASAFAVASTAFAGPAAAADGDWAASWQSRYPGTYDDGAFVFSNSATIDGLFTSPWTLSSTDVEFEAHFDAGTIQVNGDGHDVRQFGPGHTPVYGQTVLAPHDATSIESLNFTIAWLSGTGPFVVRPFVLHWDSAHDTPAAAGAWFGVPVALTSLSGTPQVLGFQVPNVPVTSGDEYVIGLTTLMDGVSAGSDDPQSLVYEAVGRSTGCEPGHGWTPSWQEWANGGSGGPVCTRTLMWTSTQGWLPAAVDPQTNRYIPVPDATR